LNETVAIEVEMLEIKVMTYNIHHGKGTDKQLNLNRIAEVIEKSGADIIGLNEVDMCFSKRSHYKDQIRCLAKKLNMYVAFAPSLSFSSMYTSVSRQYGNALLSRYPILEEKGIRFYLIPFLAETRSLLETLIQVNEKRIQVIVTHLGLNPILRRIQINFILNQFSKTDDPTVIMGDFNMITKTKLWRQMTNEYIDVWRTSGYGNGGTYPSSRPKLRLDYIFINDQFKVLGTEVITSVPKASDHLPLYASLWF